MVFFIMGGKMIKDIVALQVVNNKGYARVGMVIMDKNCICLSYIRLFFIIFSVIRLFFQIFIKNENTYDIYNYFL